MHLLPPAPCRKITGIIVVIFFFLSGNIYYWAQMWASLPPSSSSTPASSALCWPIKTPLYKVLWCLDTHAFSARSVHSLHRSAQLFLFEGRLWWRKEKKKEKKSSQRFVALSNDFLCLVRDIGIADRSFYASLRDVLGTNCLQGAIGAGSLSPYNAERSSLSSLSVWTQRRRTLRNCFHGLTDWLIGISFFHFFLP